MKTIFILLSLNLYCFNLQAQIKPIVINRFQLLGTSANAPFSIPIDTYYIDKTDSLPKAKKTPMHNPKLATIMSAVVPGAGQIYNKKYWKTPIIWAGLGTCGYFIRSNHILYKDYKNALLQRNDTSIKVPDKYFEIYSTDQLLALQDQYRQNRDLFIIVTTLVYALNIVDALVDAHLFSFDVSDDLSLHWQPYYQYSVNTRNTAGISVQLNFRYLH